MKIFAKKALSVILCMLIICTMFAFLSGSVFAAGTSKYADFIKYRGQDLKNTYHKLKSGGELNVLYYGGSVTNGTGASDAGKYSWRALVGEWLTENFPKATINNYNVAYGGTSSMFGAYRLNEDVISKDPDLIFIEFSINDHYDNQVRKVTKEEAARRYETIVRNIWNEVPDCDIVTVLTTEKGYININRNGEVHTQAQGHEDVSITYKIPSLHIGRALVSKLSYGDISGDWDKYMTDIVHPNDKGYALYFEVFEEYLVNCLLHKSYSGKVQNHSLPRQIHNTLLDGNITFIDADSELVKSSDKLGGKNFTYSDGYSTLRDSFDGGVSATGGSNSKFVVEFTGTELTMIQHSDTVESFQITVDGKTDFVKCYGIKPEILVSGLNYGKHTLSISPVYENGASSGLFWIQGFFARNEEKATAKYDHEKHVIKSYVSNKDATCLKNGTKTGKCTVKGCDYKETIEDKGSKLPHKYVIEVVEPATATKDGLSQKVCSVCDEPGEQIVIPKGKTLQDIIAQENSLSQQSESTTSSEHPSVSADSLTGDIQQEDITTELIILGVVLFLLLSSIVFLIIIIIKRKSSVTKD